jgi:hypothetical protein
VNIKGFCILKKKEDFITTTTTTTATNDDDDDDVMVMIIRTAKKLAQWYMYSRIPGFVSRPGPPIKRYFVVFLSPRKMP